MSRTRCAIPALSRAALASVRSCAIEECPELGEDLGRALNPDCPNMTLGRSIANLVVCHGFWYLGDIRYTKSLMGMPFALARALNQSAQVAPPTSPKTTWSATIATGAMAL